MKHMKKSLFFTTVMMVVLLVVALSTATFAWYTSSNTVTISEAVVSSAEASGANIAIGWDDNAPIGANNITFKDQQSMTINPMVPYLGEDGELTKDDTFLTASLSNGELPNPTSGTPYQAKSDGDEEVFYIINYSAKATNITFSCTVTGENADRLRVAIFRESDGVCVYTNKDFYSGEIQDAVERKYASPETEPEGWAEYFNNTNPDNGNPAFSSSNESTDNPVQVQAVAPEFTSNRYYQASDGYSQALLDPPTDWGTAWFNYSTTQGYLTPVLGVAPAWEQGKYFTLSAYEPPKLKVSTSPATAINVATNLEQCSDGITGVYKAFRVKAWFDGPTQVDAFGGDTATFAITAKSNPIG